MAGIIAFVLFVVVVGVLYARMLSKRNDLEPEVTSTPRNRRQSRMDRKLAKIREFDPLPEPKTLKELLQEELEESGAGELPGADGLEVTVLLRVWQRDEAVRTGCAPGGLRYEISPGIEPTDADVDNVRLVCEQSLHDPRETGNNTDEASVAVDEPPPAQPPPPSG